MYPRSFSPVLRMLRLCLHLLMAVLLVLVAVRALLGGPGSATAAGVVTASVTMAVVYGAGPLLPRVRESRGAAATWLGALGAVWLALLMLTPDGVWLAFPLFFLHLHLLPARWGLPAVVLTTAAAIGAAPFHGQAFGPGTVIGPMLGAAVAVATVLGYQALHRENERRRELIEELITTRAELADAERTAGTLAERERIAREIHDTVAQGLSSIQLLLRAAERAVPPDSSALPHIQQARTAAQDNLTEVRHVVRALTPPDLADNSLPAALERLCTSVPDAPDAPTTHFSLSGTPVTLPMDYEVALLRIAQSAIGNTVRHAHAHHAELTLSYMDTAVALDVVDNGNGFDPTTIPAHSDDGGLGLAAMRARAESLGGTVVVESSPGRGTAL
ncbi:sensor histidine kinase [Haloechinothrix salitolerans]|uniref:Oxygen sensor histidine kinase NreB n=1 Tax=Haloechinothrix salitolerans TaxID=926830 RepID=A0ABW2C1J6_9PSEU